MIDAPAPPQLKVVIADSRRGGYVREPHIEQEILDPHAEVVAVAVETPAELLDVVEDADALICWHHIAIERPLLARLRRCRGIVRAGVGFDNIDLAFAGELGIPVCNVPDYGTEEVADHTLALILALARKLRVADLHARTGGWDWRVVGSVTRLRGATLGIVGFGRIGTAVSRRAAAFGLSVEFYDPFVPSGIEKSQAVRRCETLEELLERSVVVSLHVPLTPATHHLIGRAELGRMQKDAILINTSRGEVIDQEALIEALLQGRLGQTGLDVLSGEPVVPVALRQSDRVLLTAHSAFYADASLAELRRKAADAALRFLLDKPDRNVVNAGFISSIRSLPAEAAAHGRRAQ